MLTKILHYLRQYDPRVVILSAGIILIIFFVIIGFGLQRMFDLKNKPSQIANQSIDIHKQSRDIKIDPTLLPKRSTNQDSTSKTVTTLTPTPSKKPKIALKKPYRKFPHLSKLKKSSKKTINKHPVKYQAAVSYSAYAKATACANSVCSTTSVIIK